MLPVIGLITAVIFLLLSPLNGLVVWSLFAPLFDTVTILKVGNFIPQVTFNRIFFLVILVVYFWVGRRENTAVPPEKGRLEKLMLFFAVVFFMEIYLQYRPKDATRNLIGFFEGFVGPFILFAMARYYVRDWKAVEKIFTSLLVMGVLLALIGIYEQVTRIDLINFTVPTEGMPEGLQGLREEEHWVRSNGTFGTPESYGITLAMLFFVGLYKLRTLTLRGEEPLIRGTVLLIALAVIGAGIFCSMFRNIWLGVLVGLFVGIMLRPGKKAGRVTLLVVVFLSLVLVMRLLSLGGTLASDRFLVKETMYSRIGSYSIALQAFREHPLLGLGYSGFEQYAKNFTEDLAYKDVRAAKQAHNTFLSVLAENGIIGFIPFILFWIAVLRGAAGLVGKAGSAREKELAVTLLSVAAALIIPWFFERTGYYPALNNLFFLVFGVTAGLFHWGHPVPRPVRKSLAPVFTPGRLIPSPLQKGQ